MSLRTKRILPEIVSEDRRSSREMGYFPREYAKVVLPRETRSELSRDRRRCLQRCLPDRTRASRDADWWLCLSWPTTRSIVETDCFPCAEVAHRVDEDRDVKQQTKAKGVNSGRDPPSSKNELVRRTARRSVDSCSCFQQPNEQTSNDVLREKNQLIIDSLVYIQTSRAKFKYERTTTCCLSSRRFFSLSLDRWIGERRRFKSWLIDVRWTSAVCQSSRRRQLQGFSAGQMNSLVELNGQRTWLFEVSLTWVSQACAFFFFSLALICRCSRSILFHLGWLPDAAKGKSFFLSKEKAANMPAYSTDAKAREKKNNCCH